MFSRGKKDKSTPIQERYPVCELPAPLSIPIEEEKKIQGNNLGPTDSPFEPTRKAYESFGLSLKVCYEVKDGILSVGAWAYSKEEAVKIIASQSEAIKKALNVDISGKPLCPV